MASKAVSDWLYHENWNFKTTPPGSDITAYSKALLICANGDGEISEPERRWVLGYSEAKGLSADVLEMLKTYPGTEDIGKVVASAPAVNKSRRALVYDALRAAAADGVLHEAEWEMIKKMAGHLGIAEADTKAIRNAYEEERKARDRRVAVCFPDGTPF